MCPFSPDILVVESPTRKWFTVSDHFVGCDITASLDVWSLVKSLCGYAA